MADDFVPDWAKGAPATQAESVPDWARGAEQKTSQLEQIGHGIARSAYTAGPYAVGMAAGAGLGAMAGGVGAIPGAALGLGAVGLTDLIGSTARAFGIPIPTLSQTVDSLMTKAGLPEPKTKQERLVQDAARGILSGGSAVGIGQSMAGMAKPAVARIGQVLAESPGLQVLSGGYGNLAAGVAGEKGAGPGTQYAAGMAASMVPSVALGRSGLASAAFRSRSMSPFDKSLIESGYTIPPTRAGKPLVGDALEGYGGGARVFREARIKNQELSNTFAAKSIGTGDLMPESLAEAKVPAFEAYKKVADASLNIAPDTKFQKTVLKIGKNQKAIEEFPELVKNLDVLELQNTLASHPAFSSEAGVQLVRELRQQSSANIRSDIPTQKSYGWAQREAANAIDDLIERSLSKDPAAKGLVSEYKDARVQLAKIHDIEAATNPVTGNINAVKLGRMAKAGRPFTDYLRHVAHFGLAHGPVAGPVDNLPSNPNYSVLDIAALLSGNKALGGGAMLRPMARIAATSRPFQRAMAAEEQPIGQQLVPFAMSGGK